MNDLDPADSPVGALELLEFLVRHRLGIAAAALLGALTLGTLSVTRAPSYTSTAMILPDTRGVPGGRLAGLAAQFGVFPPSSGGTLPAPLFVELLRAKPLLRQLVTARYPAAGGATLIDYWGVSGDDEGQRIERAIRQLRGSVSVSTTPETGSVSLAIEAGTPALAAALVGRALELLDSISLQARQRQAAVEQRFFESRLRDASDSLREASERAVAFLERNRVIANAPSLVFQYEQLQQRVAGAQTLYQSLQQSYETARLDAARSVPAFLVIEEPTIPTVRDPRGTFLKAVLGGLLGAVAALTWFATAAWWAAIRGREPDRVAAIRTALRRRG